MDFNAFKTFNKTHQYKSSINRFNYKIILNPIRAMSKLIDVKIAI